MARDGKIAAWTDGSRSSLNLLSQSWNFGTHGLSNLVVLSSEQYEVVGRSSLKFFTGYSFQMLHIIFTDTWVVSSNDLIKTLLDSRSHGSMSVLILLNCAGIG